MCSVKITYIKSCYLEPIALCMTNKLKIARVLELMPMFRSNLISRHMSIFGYVPGLFKITSDYIRCMGENMVKYSCLSLDYPREVVPRRYPRRYPPLSYYTHIHLIKGALDKHDDICKLIEYINWMCEDCPSKKNIIWHIVATLSQEIHTEVGQKLFAYSLNV